MKSTLLLLIFPLSANASFLCDGRKLVTQQGAIYNFNSDQQCTDALNYAQNGFLCDGHKLITHGGLTIRFSSDAECTTAVKNSK